MISVLITGAGGQLGRELVRLRWPFDVEIHAYSSHNLDIADQEAVELQLKKVDPDVVVNAAAYTAVDQAEDDQDRAMSVNGAAVSYLAQASNSVRAQLIHISTDYVFDGSKDDWYVETDPTAPLGVYGRGKAIGEQAAQRADRSVVLRTAWVYGALGSNFVSTMLRLAAERDVLGVVDDQIGCPTSAADLAAAIASVIEVTEVGKKPPPSSLYHLASPTSATWHEFAMAIFECSDTGFAGECRKLTTAEFPTRAARPANSRLDSGAIQRDLGLCLKPWQESLPVVVGELEATDD